MRAASLRRGASRRPVGATGTGEPERSARAHPRTTTQVPLTNIHTTGRANGRVRDTSRIPGGSRANVTLRLPAVIAWRCFASRRSPVRSRLAP
jgi:hypothetical protein